MSLLFDRDRVVGRKSGAMDGAPFKVGDKIRLKRMPSDSPSYKIERIEGNRLWITWRDGTPAYFTDYDSVKVSDEATDADEVKSANGKVLKVGSLVVPMSFTDKENKRHLSRVVLKITPNGESGFGPYVYLKGAPAPYKPNDLYAYDGCADDAAPYAELWQSDLMVGLKVKEAKSGRRGIVTRVDADGDPWVKFDNGSVGKVLLSSLVKDSADAQDANETEVLKMIAKNYNKVFAAFGPLDKSLGDMVNAASYLKNVCANSGLELTKIDALEKNAGELAQAVHGFASTIGGLMRNLRGVGV